MIGYNSYSTINAIHIIIMCRLTQFIIFIVPVHLLLNHKTVRKAFEPERTYSILSKIQINNAIYWKNNGILFTTPKTCICTYMYIQYIVRAFVHQSSLEICSSL